jgi:hypothetical protein
VTAIFPVRYGFISKVALHLDDTKNLFVFNFLEFCFGEFSFFDFFTRFEDYCGTFKRADMFASEGWREGSEISLTSVDEDTET